MKINQSYLARRRFLSGMLGGGAAALGASVAVPLVGYVGNLKEAPPPEWMEIEKTDYALAPGTSKLVMYGHIPALLIQTREPGSELRVFDATCTHFDCTVRYVPEEDHILCACHEGYYRVDGSVISGPPPRPLRKFWHRLHNGKLVIALEKENLEKAFQDS
ncbi:MAG: Rieske (2Fe-2S) protein [Planctomycetes bacterium]|nr:Rieske (2Fe-2S) protein [Planctomycetota bacterium]